MTARRPVLRCTRDLLELLDKEHELWIFEDEVDPNLELGCIQRIVSREKGPALLFTNVKGTGFPVATNLYGSEKRLNLAFGEDLFALSEQIKSQKKGDDEPRILMDQF